MQEPINRLLNHETLTQTDAHSLMEAIADATINDELLAVIITVYKLRCITIEELLGFRQALMERCVSIPIRNRKTIDIVGTGGDGKNTFNISTLSSLVVAGLGVSVAKHGNYGLSSTSGASNVMEQCGYRFSADATHVLAELDECNFSFLHAPLFHPSLKVVSSVRKKLRFRTFFNLLGPLINPSQPDFQLIGVFNLETARLYHFVLQADNKNYTIVYSYDGYDEISLTSDTKVITPQGEFNYGISDFNQPQPLAPSSLFGGHTVSDAAALFMKVIKGEGSLDQNQVVCANAATALVGAGFAADYDTCWQAAKECLASQQAYRNFKKVIALNNQLNKSK